MLRLRAARADGRLAQACAATGIELVVLFGSAATEPDPHGLVGDALDVLDLDRAGPVARQRALTQGEVLVQLRPGAFATRQMAAMREFIETDPFRRLDLEMMGR